MKFLPVPDIDNKYAGQSNAAYYNFHVLLFVFKYFSSIDWRQYEASDDPFQGVSAQ